MGQKSVGRLREISRRRPFQLSLIRRLTLRLRAGIWHGDFKKEAGRTHGSGGRRGRRIARDGRVAFRQRFAILRAARFRSCASAYGALDHVRWATFRISVPLLDARPASHEAPCFARILRYATIALAQQRASAMLSFSRRLFACRQPAAVSAAYRAFHCAEII